MVRTCLKAESGDNGKSIFNAAIAYLIEYLCNKFEFSAKICSCKRHELQEALEYMCIIFCK